MQKHNKNYTQIIKTHVFTTVNNAKNNTQNIPNTLSFLYHNQTHNKKKKN